MEDTTPAGKPIVDREKTAPFLIRTFIKIGTFHRLQQFEDGPLPLADEQAIYTWKDATLREVLTTLRSTAPGSTEYRHPLARYAFRAVFADAAARGRFSQKELGTVYSRDILGEPGSLDRPAPRLVEDDETGSSQATEQDRTLDELRFVPGDYLCVAVHLPKGVTVPAGPGGELAIKGSAVGPGASAPPSNGWKAAGGRGDGGWGGSLAAAPGPGAGRGGGGHWRGNSGPEPPVSRGARGGRGGEFGGRDRDRDRGGDRDDRRVPPPRRDSPPRREGWGRRPPSRSRSPPRRRGRYD
ncbi:Sin3 associated polypeptide p18-domain-containing protein [Trametes meyenii]|nr:Sin3 associated polypeptide p18-domain-containing protein [Trametes meyenii]